MGKSRDVKAAAVSAGGDTAEREERHMIERQKTREDIGRKNQISGPTMQIPSGDITDDMDKMEKDMHQENGKTMRIIAHKGRRKILILRGERIKK